MLGIIRAIRQNGGDVSTIVWSFEGRDVYVCEVPAIGQKRAMYCFERGTTVGRSKREADRFVARLEAQAQEAMDSYDPSADDLVIEALSLGIDLSL